MIAAAPAGYLQVRKGKKSVAISGSCTGCPQGVAGDRLVHRTRTAMGLLLLLFLRRSCEREVQPMVCAVVRVSPLSWHAAAPLCGSGKYRTFFHLFPSSHQLSSRKMKYNLNVPS